MLCRVFKSLFGQYTHSFLSIPSGDECPMEGSGGRGRENHPVAESLRVGEMGSLGESRAVH